MNWSLNRHQQGEGGGDHVLIYEEEKKGQDTKIKMTRVGWDGWSKEKDPLKEKDNKNETWCVGNQ